MKRRGGAVVVKEEESDEASAANSISPALSPESSNNGNKKRSNEVIDLLDSDDDEDGMDKKESASERKRRKQEEADEEFARRLQQQEQQVGANPYGVKVKVENDGTTTNNTGNGFHKLASIVIYQLVSRQDAAESLQRLLKNHVQGSRLTPQNVLGLGADNLASILGEKSAKKANAIVDLARKWSTLPPCPTHRIGPCDQADKKFVASINKSAQNGGVANIGKWTLNTFLENLGRTDILNADCYEVQSGVYWLTGETEKRSAHAVRTFCGSQNFRPHSLSQVSGILRDLHRSVQDIVGKKRKTNMTVIHRAMIDQAIARTRQDLAGL